MKPGDLVKYKEKYRYFPDGFGIILGTIQRNGFMLIRLLWEDGRISETYEESVEVVREGR